MHVFSSVLLVAICVVVEGLWEDIILQPPTGKVGPESVLLFGQGADIATSQYSNLLSSLQNAVAFPLWIGIPQCAKNACSIPGTLSSGMDRITKLMKLQGMRARYTFYGGHSLGGAMMPGYVSNETVVDSANGMILLGSFLTRKFKTGKTVAGRPQMEFPVPTLTIGGELDGLCRISRIAEAHYTQITFAEDPVSAAKKLAVTAIEGMNHMQFASGEPPKFVSENDIQSEISEAIAHELVVADMTSYLSAIVKNDDTSWKRVTDRVAESEKFLKPIVDAFLMEGYVSFLPPCYCETPDEYGYLQYGTCATTASCLGGVPWTGEYAQPLMGGLPSISIVATDSIHLVTEEKPSCHLPHIHGNPQNNANPGNGDTPALCEKPDGACTLNITTVTEPIYENGGEVDLWRLHFSVESLDTGFLPITARELKTKLKSRQAVWEAAGVKNVSYTETDVIVADGGVADVCGQINQAAIDWALKQLPAKTLKRYEQYGQQLQIGPDKSTCIAGPCWIWDSLVFARDAEANVVTIQSVYFAEENYNKYPCGEDKLIPCSAGFHYCKLLSPARALEWMYVDGLKNKLSTKTAVVNLL